MPSIWTPGSLVEGVGMCACLLPQLISTWDASYTRKRWFLSRNLYGDAPLCDLSAAGSACKHDAVPVWALSTRSTPAFHKTGKAWRCSAQDHPLFQRVHMLLFQRTLVPRTLYQHPQLPFKRPQIPSNRDHKALNRAALGGLGTWYGF